MNDLTRRGLMSTALGVLAAVPLQGWASPATARVQPRLRRRTFRPLVGRRLTVSGRGRRVNARLARVSDIPGAKQGSDASFALELVTSHDLPDGIYTVSGHGAGRHQLFLSGVGDDRTRSYEAVVNRTHA